MRGGEVYVMGEKEWAALSERERVGAIGRMVEGERLRLLPHERDEIFCGVAYQSLDVGWSR